MSRTKDLYMDACEARAAELVESGMGEDEAWDIATERAYADLGDHMADLSDRARDMAKERGL